jgi:hypothetical protein
LYQKDKKFVGKSTDFLVLFVKRRQSHLLMVSARNEKAERGHGFTVFFVVISFYIRMNYVSFVINHLISMYIKWKS